MPPEPAPAGNFLTKKFGPLPAWGWAAAAGVALLALRIGSGGRLPGLDAIGGTIGGAGGPGGGNAIAVPKAVNYTGAATVTAGASTPGEASGSGTFAAPAVSVAEPAIIQASVASTGPSDTAPVLSAAVTSPALTSPETVAAGGPIATSPQTSPYFQAPFVAPYASVVAPAGEDPYTARLVESGNLPIGAQTQIVGGVPISLSAEAVTRGGIAARDIPLASGLPNTIPVATVPSSGVGATP